MKQPPGLCTPRTRTNFSSEKRFDNTSRYIDDWWVMTDWLLIQSTYLSPTRLLLQRSKMPDATANTAFLPGHHLWRPTFESRFWLQLRNKSLVDCSIVDDCNGSNEPRNQPFWICISAKDKKTNRGSLGSGAFGRAIGNTGPPQDTLRTLSWDNYLNVIQRILVLGKLLSTWFLNQYVYIYFLQWKYTSTEANLSVVRVRKADKKTEIAD